VSELLPSDVKITHRARAPEHDPKLGIDVNPPTRREASHRLVALGDSLTMGFQSGAITRADLSYPAMIARELGCYDSFRHPNFLEFGGLGMPIEYLVRQLEGHRRAGRREAGVSVDDLGFLESVLSQVKDHWDRGPADIEISAGGGIMHNLGVAGFDIEDLMSTTAATVLAEMRPWRPDRLLPRVENAGALMALYTLQSARDPRTGRPLSPVGAAAALGRDGGIETMIVLIGSNNALGTVIDLTIRWSEEGRYTGPDRRMYNLWRPSHFEHAFGMLAQQVRAVNAAHVIWGTVPHVTVAPLARGVGNRKPCSRFYQYYVRPWVADGDVEAIDLRLTARDARIIDSVIDQYNGTIVEAVRQARCQGRDWLLLDTAALMDSLASRRYLAFKGDDQCRPEGIRPEGFRPYNLPPELAALDPPPNSQFFASGPGGLTNGGLFSLDGVHPTTIGYSIVAQEFIKVMEVAGVEFRAPDGAPRVGPIVIDFENVVREDSLISNAPRSVTSILGELGRVDPIIELANRLMGSPPASIWARLIQTGRALLHRGRRVPSGSPRGTLRAERL
jgi:hypothetical protein